MCALGLRCILVSAFANVAAQDNGVKQSGRLERASGSLFPTDSRRETEEKQGKPACSSQVSISHLLNFGSII